LHVVRVADPAAPTEVKTLEIAGGARSVFVSGNLAFVIDGSGSVAIVDTRISAIASTSTPVPTPTPVPISTLPVPLLHKRGSKGSGDGQFSLASAIALDAAGHSARFTPADNFSKTVAQARVDHSLEKVFRSFMALDLLILDDLGLHRLNAHQSAHL